MNIRKEIDYSTMHTALDFAVAQNLPQMEMYCEIGKAICARPEKGAAVAAASYLSERYPNMADDDFLFLVNYPNGVFKSVKIIVASARGYNSHK